MHAVCSQPIINITHKPLNEVAGGGADGHLVGELQEQAPVDNLAAGGEGVITVVRSGGRIRGMKFEGSERYSTRLKRSRCQLTILRQVVRGAVTVTRRGADKKV